MNIRTLLGLSAVSVVITQTGSAAILLAGWNEFTTNASLISHVNSPANEGVSGMYNHPTTLFRHTRATDSGGSTDNWYGPDSAARGGMKTGQTPYVGVKNDEIPGSGDPRLNAGYTDPTGFVGNQPGTTMNGRVAVTNDSDLILHNGTQTSYELQSFVFDAFLGDVNKPTAVANIANFTVSHVKGGTTYNYSILAQLGYSGVHSNPVGGLTTGSPADTRFTDNGITIPVPNAIVYGTGSNYVDYVLDLSGFILDPGDTLKVRFNQTGSGAVRLDNAAFIAVPEPSSALLISSLMSLSLLRRRRRA
ncbi:PEP-CTERM sorting domain-containing protein [Haloferula chungangensis]|uniref:PEP-CTERM sorting domain-containing protein n=1 Tax=Haloferula chungangensis TaxID=1048331 RepID=A0ABW2LAN8_9BACT